MKEYKTEEYLRERCKAYYHRNKERVKQRQKAYYHRVTKPSLKQDPRPRMWASARNRANKKNIEFTITLDDIIVPDTCPMLGIPMAVAEGGALDSSPSLDRVDNKLGYIKTNIHVISHRANYLKGSATLDELISMGKYAGEIKQ